MNNVTPYKMKKIYYTIFAAAALFAGCNSEVIAPEGSGSLAIDLSCRSDYTEVETKATDDEIINDLAIEVTRPYDGWKKSYTPFSTIRGKVVELGSGDYILNASSQEKEHAAFEQPVYEGSKNFKIVTGQVTTVDLVCAISNVKVTVNLSDNFVRELSDYRVTVSNGKGNLSWKKSATENDFKPIVVDGKTAFTSAKAGYFSVSPLEVVVTGHRAIDNSEASTTIYIDEVNAADHHILNIDAKVTGAVGITISISHEVNEIGQTVVVPGFDEIPVPGDGPAGDEGDDTGDQGGETPGGDNTGTETPVDPVPSDAPVLEWVANPNFAPMNIDENLDADLLIKAPGKIATFVVTVDSPQLSMTIAALCSYADDYDYETLPPADMDMINDAVLIENLAGMDLGLPLGNDILGQTEVPFSLSGLIPLIDVYKPAYGTEHNFTLKVTDEKGQVLEKKVVFVSVTNW